MVLSHKVCTMQFLHSKLVFYVEERLSLDPIFSFFSSHFMITEGSQEDALATIYITQSTAKFADIDFTHGDPIFLRKSVSEFFTIPALSVVREGIQYIKCTKSEKLIAIDSEFSSEE